MENKKVNPQKQNLIIDFFNEFKKDKTGMMDYRFLLFRF